VVGDASKHRYLKSSRELAYLVDELRFGVGKERRLELGDECIGMISSLIERCLQRVLRIPASRNEWVAFMAR